MAKRRVIFALLSYLWLIAAFFLCGWRQYHVGDGTVACAADESQCGCGLRWPSDAEVRYTIDSNGLPGLERTALVTAIDSAFATWRALLCDGEPLPVRLVNNGSGTPTPVGGTCTHSDPTSGACDTATNNGNYVQFFTNEQAWSDTSHQGLYVYALTVLTFTPRTGEIFDADILVNAANHKYCLTKCADDVLCNTLTHEVGHLLGLDHSKDPKATMSPSALPGDTNKCAMHADDRLGMCTIYRSVCAQRAGEEPSNCSAAPAQPVGGSSFLWFCLVGILGLGVWRVRTRLNIHSK